MRKFLIFCNDHYFFGTYNDYFWYGFEDLMIQCMWFPVLRINQFLVEESSV